MTQKTFCAFSELFLNMLRIFLVCQKKKLQTFFFLQGFFVIKIHKIFQFILKTFGPCINFYINLFSASTNTVALIQLLHVLYI